jgi:murein DD-endopeptidase MepM/ murein hydrolase activator NlpD
VDGDLCMRSVCCDSGRLRPAASVALGLLGASLLATAAPSAAGATTTWLMGVFPVAVFSGFTSGFGNRVHPLSGGLRPHYGVDIAAPLGSPVLSWWSGRVQEVISDGGCGNGLVIRSGDYEHIYCHLAGRVGGGVYSSGPVTLRPGQVVRRGQLIAHVGMTGSTTGPHLHWGMRFRGQWLDPARILRAMAASRRASMTRGAAPNVGTSR